VDLTPGAECAHERLALGVVAADVREPHDHGASLRRRPRRLNRIGDSGDGADASVIVGLVVGPCCRYAAVTTSAQARASA
jgi:hypothetical protein